MNSVDSQRKRILSVDVFRGLVIVLMILVNGQGTRNPYPLLEHSLWNGCSLADLVFPAFLYIVGITIVISAQKFQGVRDLRKVHMAIMQRTVLLFLVGLFLNAYPSHFDWESIRVYGILQRIALCYCVCALLFLHTRVNTQALILLIILLSYWLLFTYLPVPGSLDMNVTITNNWIGYIDQHLFSSRHLFSKTFDPEGLLSTVPAISTTLLGVLTGHLLLSPDSQAKKTLIMSLCGCVLLLLAFLWNCTFPINKLLWSSSFVMWTGGISMLSFCFCFVLIDVLGITRWALPFKIFGMNALFAFIFHVLLLKTQGMVYLPLRNGQNDNLRSVITDYIFGSFNAQNAGLFYSLLFLLFNFLAVSILYKRKVFIKL